MNKADELNCTIWIDTSGDFGDINSDATITKWSDRTYWVELYPTIVTAHRGTTAFAIVEAEYSKRGRFTHDRPE